MNIPLIIEGELKSGNYTLESLSLSDANTKTNPVLDNEIIYNSGQLDNQNTEFFNNLENFINNYGPEPFSSKFNLNYLKKYFYKKKKNIKNFLLDQKFVSGLGNIYASEILFSSKINPRKKAKSLSENDCINIIKYSRKILNLAIKKGGSSIRDFKNIVGKNGSFQDNFKVYNRENKSCLSPGCKGTIKKKFITNRSTFFCNICQK